MAIYNGFIVGEPDFQNDTIEVLASNGRILDNNKFYNLVYRKATKEERMVLDNYFSNQHIDADINDNEVSKIINKYYHIDSTYHKKTPIVFELFYDNDGNMYGKELSNNRIFPVLKQNGYNYSLECERRSGIVQVDGRKYFTKGQNQNIYYSDSDKFSFMHSDKIDGNAYVIESHNYKINYRVKEQEIVYHKLTLKPILIHTNKAYFNAPIILDKPATNEDIIEYNNSPNIGRRNRIINASRTNTFKVDPEKLIYPANKGDKPTRSEILNLIDNIELLLNRLFNLNNDLYNKYYEKYRKIITNNTNSNIAIDYQKELNNLVNEIEEAIKYIYSNKEFVDYLDKIINDNIIDFKLNLNDINNITNKFYDYVMVYSIDVISAINNRIGILYFLYLTNNKYDINHLMNDNPYIKDNLKIIYVVMSNLARKGYLDNFHELSEITINSLSELIFNSYLTINDKNNIKII